MDELWMKRYWVYEPTTRTEIYLLSDESNEQWDDITHLSSSAVHYADVAAVDREKTDDQCY